MARQFVKLLLDDTVYCKIERRGVVERNYEKWMGAQESDEEQFSSDRGSINPLAHKPLNMPWLATARDMLSGL